jgi:hypothetical protein
MPPSRIPQAVRGLTVTAARMLDPPTMNSVSREPQLPQRQRSRTSGTSPWPAAISAARSAVFA